MSDSEGQLWVALDCRRLLVILSAVVWRPLIAQDAFACLSLTTPGRSVSSGWGGFSGVGVIGRAQTSFLVLGFQDGPRYLRFLSSSKLCPISSLGNIDPGVGGSQGLSSSLQA